MDESDLPAIERAASDAEIQKWFDLGTRRPADYLAAKRRAWAEGTGGSFAIWTRLGAMRAWATSSSSVTTMGAVQSATGS